MFSLRNLKAMVGFLLVTATTASTCRGGVIITEIMYNPATSEPRGEWVEIYNSGSTPVDVTGWKLDDEDASDWSPLSGSLAPKQVGVIFNSKIDTESDFRDAWNLSSEAALFGVSWGSLLNSPSFDDERLRLVDDLDHEVDFVNYDDANGWPSDDGQASIYLTDVALDNNLGSSWGLSTVGQDGARNPTVRFSMSDIGSPGFVSGTATNVVPEPATATAFALLVLSTAAQFERRRTSRGHRKHL